MILNNRSVYKYISDFVQTKSANDTDLIILIGGLSRVGKTTFSTCLSAYLNCKGYKVKNLCLDNWILDQKKRLPKMTVRERFDYNGISSSINQLLEERHISVSRYDPITKSSHENQLTLNLNKNDILLIEGVVALDIPYLRNLSFFSIFIFADENKRKERFFNYYLSNGFSLDYVESLYLERWDNENSIIIESQKYADLIINENQIMS